MTDQRGLDRAALAAFPELAHLVLLRQSRSWHLEAHTDSTGRTVLVSGERVHPDGSKDVFGVRGASEARAVRKNPLGELVFRREGTLTEIVEALVDLPSPLHPLAPHLVLNGGVEPSLWVPSSAGARRRTW